MIIILKKLFVLTLLTIFTQAFSQETMNLKDGKSYAATPSWDFISENYALTGTTKIQIAKTEKGGVLQLTADATDNSFLIGGVVYVDLDDNTVIVCTDKNLNENSNGRMTSWYLFSPIEMGKLRKTNIASIRFNIKGVASKFTSQIGNFTAVNKKSYFSTIESKPKQFDTASEINALY